MRVLFGCRYGSDNDDDEEGGLGNVQFIDYEYAADAMVGLDIANHMSGCTELIEGASVTFDTSLCTAAHQPSCRHNQPCTDCVTDTPGGVWWLRAARSDPTTAQQMHFLNIYLTARGFDAVAETLRGDAAAGVFARQLLVAMAAEAECRWIVWGLLQMQISSVSFDFGDYAAQRWSCYSRYKAWATQGMPANRRAQLA